jgi:hypothetical protein
LVTLDNSVLPAPTDGLVRPAPPKAPVHAPNPAPTPSPTPAPSPAPALALAELVDKKYAGRSATELAGSALDILKGLSPAKAALLTQALGVDTVAGLADHRIILAAQAIALAARN